MSHSSLLKPARTPESVAGLWQAAVMPRRAEYDERAVSVLLRKQHGVIAREQALSCGVSGPTLNYRGRAGGAWPAILPGVYLTHTGSPSCDQREMAALLYAGPRSVLTATAALRRFGLAGPRTEIGRASCRERV